MTSQPIETACGTRDGSGAGDRDQPFRYGHKPTTLAPYPFSTRQYARLLVLRSRMEAGVSCTDDGAPEHRMRWLRADPTRQPLS